MKIALIGATGNAGQRLVNELTSRGHAVTGISRNAAEQPARDGVTWVSADLNDSDNLAGIIKGHDAAIFSVQFNNLDFGKVIDAGKKAGVRILVVGGAASLKNDEGVVLLDTPGFPDFIKVEAAPARAALDELKASEGLDWTFLSPSMFFGPGERTGKFRLGTDTILTAEDGQSSISYEDYAVALTDEIETPAHRNQRFTVGY